MVLWNVFQGFEKSFIHDYRFETTIIKSSSIGELMIRGARVVDTAVMPDSSPFVHEVTSDESLATQGLQVRFLCGG